MATFITIGYGDSAGYEQTDASVLDAAHADDQQLRDAGALMGTAGPPIQSRSGRCRCDRAGAARPATASAPHVPSCVTAFRIGSAA